MLGSISRKYAHKIPFLVKLNHNELLTYPNHYDQTLFASVDQAFELGAVAVGATVFYGSPEARRQILEVSEAFAHAHELGMVTFLWAYLRNSAFKKDGVDYHTAADLTGQANHLAVTIEADIIKQKQAQTNGGYNAIQFGKTHPRVYEELTSDHPVDLVRYQVANCYMGRIGMINSGGPSGKDDLHQAVRTAGHQQTCWRNGTDFRAQGVSAADGRRDKAAQCDPGRLPVTRRDDRLILAGAVMVHVLLTGGRNLPFPGSIPPGVASGNGARNAPCGDNGKTGPGNAGVAVRTARKARHLNSTLRLVTRSCG